MSRTSHVHIPNASSSWKLIMQSGIGLSVTVGLPLSAFLTAELGLTDQSQQLIEAFLLDGMPVDDPSTAVVENGSRLALAAGLPGIAGLAMNKNSAVRALRGTITHRSSKVAEPIRGRMTLALYSLVLPALGAHFLKRGIFISPGQFIRYARFAPGNACQLGDRHLTVSDLAGELSSAEMAEELFMTAIVTDAEND